MRLFAMLSRKTAGYIVMTIELESLVFLEATPGSGPLHIKVDQERGPILSFESVEVASYFSRCWGFEATMLKAAQLAPGVVGVGELFVFETVEEVDAAQQNAGTYDFAKHLRAWLQP